MTTAADWQGRVGRTWAEEAARTERSFAAIAAALDARIADVAPASGRALDIGCGIGSTTRALAACRPHLQVTGADLSTDLVALARSRALPNTRFLHGDAVEAAETLAPLDLLVSRHGVMFFDDPVTAFSRLRAAVRPGAPLVFSCFRARGENDWFGEITTALGIATPAEAGYAPGPFGFADRAFVADLMRRTGWRDAQAEPLDLPYVVGAGADPAAEALAFFRRIGPAAPLLAGAPPADRVAMEARLADVLAARTRDGATAFTAGVWIWHAVAAGDSA